MYLNIKEHLNHCAIHLKLTQHAKATVLQKKKKDVLLGIEGTTLQIIKNAGK